MTQQHTFINRSILFILVFFAQYIYAQDSYFDNPAIYWEKDELYEKISTREPVTDNHCLDLLKTYYKEYKTDLDLQKLIDRTEKLYKEEACNINDYPFLLDRLGLSYASLGNQEKALEYYYKGLHLSELVKNKEKATKIKAHIIILLVNTEKLPLAEKMCDEVLQAELNLSEKILIYSIKGMIYQSRQDADAYHNNLVERIAPLMKELNEPYRNRLFYFILSSSFQQRNEADSAMTYLKKSELLDSPNMEYRVKAYIVKGDILSSQNKNKAAFEAYNQAMSYSKEHGIDGYLSALYLHLINYYEKTNQLPKALATFKEHKAHSDSISNQKIIDLIAKNETDRKFREIKTEAAESKETSVQLSSDLSEQKTLVIYLVIAVLLIIVFVVFLVRQNKSIRQNHYYIAKKNQQLIRYLAMQQEQQPKEITIEAYDFIEDAVVDNSQNDVNATDKEPQKPWNTEIETAFDAWVKEKKYLEMDINLGTVASSIGTNRSYLSRMINHRFDQSFISLVNSLRIEFFLIQLDKNPEKNVSSLVEQSGFKSYSTFSRAFKQYTGLNLNQYTKSMNQEKDA